MSKTVRNALIAFAVVFVLSFLFSLIYMVSSQRTILSMGIGLLVFTGLQARSGTAKEQRISEAERIATLDAPVDAGTARVLVRRAGVMGRAVGIDVAMNGVTFAQLRSPRFAMLSVPPGRHVLSAANTGTGPMSQQQTGSSEFVAEPGDTLLFDLAITMGALKGSYTF